MITRFDRFKYERALTVDVRSMQPFRFKPEVPKLNTCSMRLLTRCLHPRRRS